MRPEVPPRGGRRPLPLKASSGSPPWSNKTSKERREACPKQRRRSLCCPAGAKRTALNAILAPAAAGRANKTSNQTSGGSLVSCPRLPMFCSFPFRFPFRGEKGSAPYGWGPGHRRMPKQLRVQREPGGSVPKALGKGIANASWTLWDGPWITHCLGRRRKRFEKASRMLPGLFGWRPRGEGVQIQRRRTPKHARPVRRSTQVRMVRATSRVRDFTTLRSGAHSEPT